MNELDLAFAAGFDAVKAYVDRGFSILIDRIAALEAQPHPVKGEPGETGKSVTIDDVRPLLQEMVEELPKPVDGKSIDVAEVAELIGAEVSKAVAAIPVPQDGKDGPAGRDGVDGKSVEIAEIAELIGVEVSKAVAALPAPKDGEPGVQGERGADGKSVEIAEFAELIAKEVSKIPKPKDGVGLAGAVIDRENCLVVTLSDGSHSNLGPVVGRDGERGKDGFSSDEMSVSYEDGGRIRIERYQRGTEVKEMRSKTATTIYRGVWKAGQYDQGDQVSRGGSTWTALRDTETKPDTPDCDWQLSSKRGQDGKDLRSEQSREPAVVKFK